MNMISLKKERLCYNMWRNFSKPLFHRNIYKYER